MAGLAGGQDASLTIRCRSGKGSSLFRRRLLRAVGVDAEQAKGTWLRRNGRLYELVALAADGSRLYQSEQRRGREFWLVRPDGSERPWNYQTQLGRKRPLPPPTGRWQRPG